MQALGDTHTLYLRWNVSFQFAKHQCTSKLAVLVGASVYFSYKNVGDGRQLHRHGQPRALEGSWQSQPCTQARTCLYLHRTHRNRYVSCSESGSECVYYGSLLLLCLNRDFGRACASVNLLTQEPISPLHLLCAKQDVACACRLGSYCVQSTRCK